MNIFNNRSWGDYLKQFMLIFWSVAIIMLCGHIDNNLPYTYGIYIIVNGIIIVIWLLFIEWRITDYFSLTCFRLIGILFLFILFIQNIKYNILINSSDMQRYLWYMFYVPMIIIPYILFCNAIWLVNTRKSAKRNVYRILGVITILLCVIFLTNDYHMWVFSFTDFSNADDVHDYELFFYIFIVWSAVLYIMSLVVMLRKIYKVTSVKKLIVPLISLFALILYCIIYAAIGRAPFTSNFRLQLVQAFIITIMSFIEGCISIGVIPANFGYRSLFSKSSISAEIDDLSGNTIFDTNDIMDFDINEKQRAMDSSILIDENTRLSSKRIKGGYIFWADDLTVVNETKESIKEVTEKISIQTELIRAESDIIHNKSVLEARNELYDRIAEKIKPQTDKILDLLAVDKTEQLTSEILPKNNLAKIAVYNAYIKRRSNLEIIAHEMNSELAQASGIKNLVSTQELRLSIAESLRYLELCKVECFVTGNSYVLVPSERINACYEMFEQILEQIIDDISVLAVNITADDITITIRFMITPREEHSVKIDSSLIRSAYSNVFYSVNTSYEEGSIIIKLEVLDSNIREVKR